MPPAAMAPRIDLLECLADVFVRGVLCTRVAWVIGLDSTLVRVRPGAGASTFPPGRNYVIIANGKIKL
jgi:hypothetical protein